jgi:uncharacterized membrane protein YcaP (DUF421 family)
VKENLIVFCKLARYQKIKVKAIAAIDGTILISAPTQHAFCFSTKRSKVSMMKKEDIIPWDWQRILFGNAAPEFMIEVFVRTIVMFLLMLIVLRLLGKRMDGQLALSEMAIMILLGAIVSPGMQIPERGIAIGVIALTCLLLFNRLLNRVSVEHENLEALAQGRISILVKDGVMQLDVMKHAGISRQNLFAALRERGHYNLSTIRRVYFEACGMMNVYTRERASAGLPLFPDGEAEVIRKQFNISTDCVACVTCGRVEKVVAISHACANCGASEWTHAVIEEAK